MRRFRTRLLTRGVAHRLSHIHAWTLCPLPSRDVVRGWIRIRIRTRCVSPKARRCARLCDASSCLGREVPVRGRKISLLCATTRLGRNCLAHCPALGEMGAGTDSLTCAFVGTRRSREARFSPKARYCAQASSDSRLEHGISPKARRCACPRCFLCSRALLCQRAPRHGPAALSGPTPRCRTRGPSRGRRARS